LTDAPLQNNVVCPTCGARQEWSDVCRRCKCDLRLLRAAAETYRRSRNGCLAALHGGRLALALERARDCERLMPGPESRRLSAVCALLNGDFPAAFAAAREACDDRFESASQISFNEIARSVEP